MVDFLTDDLGYAMLIIDQTGAKTLEKTTDGGMTWTVMPLPASSQEFQAFRFSASGVGVAVFRNLQNTVTPTMIYQTLNDGMSWQDISPDSTVTGIGNASCQFLNPDTGYFAAGEKIYRTTDGGNNWTAQAFGRYVVSMDFIDALHGTLGFFDGTFNYFGSMKTTSDGGATWITTDLTEIGSVIGEVGQLTPSVSYAAPVKSGAYNKLKFFKTSNNGTTWDTIFVPDTLQDASLADIHFKDVSNGVVALTSFSGIIYLYETADGGATWTFQDSLTGSYIGDLQLTSNSGYLAGGEAGRFYKLQSTLSVQEAAKDLVQVFPNPLVSGQQLSWEATARFDRLTVLDLRGNIVHQAALQTSAAYLPTLPAGMYLLKLHGVGASKTTRIIVK